VRPKSSWLASALLVGSRNHKSLRIKEKSVRRLDAEENKGEKPMVRAHFTGHPFVDAGLAALMVKAGVEHPEELTPESFDRACQGLEQVMLSPQALGINVAKSFVRGPISQIFPNSELVNPSNWKGGADNVRSKFYEGLRSDLEKAKLCLAKKGDTICPSCGDGRPAKAMNIARKVNVPLLEGIVNYYPAFAYGQPICGLCALAVRFLPMSVMRVGGGKAMWFLHTQSPEIATLIAQEYGWTHFERLISKGEALDFYGDWETAGEAGTLLYLLFELLEKFPYELETIYEASFPTTGYVFSNDNRGGFVRLIQVPNEFMRFLCRLWNYRAEYKRFRRELLQVGNSLRGKEKQSRARFVAGVARAILSADSVINACLWDNPPYLSGGWVGHRLYLEEVRRMPSSKIKMLENLGLSIARDSDAKKLVHALQTATGSELYGRLLVFVRRGWMSHEEFYQLIPPNSYNVANEIRDILLAVIYEHQNCQNKDEEFPVMEGDMESLVPDETLKRIQQVGKHLINDLPNLERWIGRLRTSRNPAMIRGAYLNAVRRGAMGWQDFIFLAPLEDANRLFLLRDYLLAYLFDKARDKILLEEIEEELEEV